MRYRVCYFEFKSHKWNIVKEYPLSFNSALLRKNYLEKCIPSLVWLEEFHDKGICESCLHRYWDEAQGENFCCMHGVFTEDDYSCPEFDRQI
ncbi:MAG: hypothetical protein ACRCW7_11880 [Cetobacterium sp.]